MKKNYLALAAISAIALTALADNFTTSGEGKNYNLSSLSALEGSPVSLLRDGVYAVSDSLTLSAGDSFVLDEDVDTILVGHAAVVDFKGHASLEANGRRVVITRLNEEAEPLSFTFNDGAQGVALRNLDFEYLGVRVGAPQELTVDSCSFRYHNGLGGRATVAYIASGASAKITNSTFAYNQTSAIGGAANYQNNTLMDGCTVYHNQLKNANQPQINLTLADSIIIRNCKITGDSSMTRSGGIGISNLMGFSETGYSLIENCIIDSCRYGITPTGPQTMTIRNNQIVHNRFETNANSGGSGISVYDPYVKSKIRITGNLIEDNLWGITVIGGGDVNIGKVSVDGVALSESDEEYNPGGNTFKDNGNGGVLYDLYNNGTQTVYAQGNTWNVAVQDSASIESVVWHQADFANLGQVIYMPCAATLGIGSVKANTPSADAVYTLEGRYMGATLDGVAPGLYVVRQNGTTGKVVVK